MCQAVQKCVHVTLGKFFKWWAQKLVKHPCKVFTLTLILYLVISLNCFNYKSFEDQESIWTPVGNESLLNRDRAKELYADPVPVNITEEELEQQKKDDDERLKFRVIQFIIEAKRPNDTAWDNLLTREAFYAMEEFEEVLYSMKMPYAYGCDTETGCLNNMTDYTGPEMIGLADLCKQYNLTTEEQDEDLEEDCNPDEPYDCPVKLKPKCFFTPRPLDFVYERFNDTYNISRYDSDKELVDKIKTGKGDEYLYDWRTLKIDGIFGGTQPEKVDQDPITGVNDIEFAKAAQIIWVLDTDQAGVSSDWATQWEKMLEVNVTEYSDNHPLLTFQIFTFGGFIDIFEDDFLADGILLLASITVVQAYCYLMLGNCSPIHCRCVQASIGLACVTFSICAGGGICFLIDLKMTTVHNILPFMLLGIGVDDMFVIVNTIDQVPDSLPFEKRFIAGIQHAGPSITITSFTNALAFFFGGFTSLVALNSFCFFACVQVCCLYVSVLTIFAAALVWDMKRMQQRKGDCCGCCKCKEDSCCFCFGYFLSPKLQKFSGIYKEPEVEKPENPYEMPKDKHWGHISGFRDMKMMSAVAGGDNDSRRNSSLRRSRSIRNMSQRGFITKDEYSSAVEKFLATVYAPELTTFQGRICVLTAWLAGIIVAIYGVQHVQINFKFDYFIPPGSVPDKYFTLDRKYFQTGNSGTVYIENDDPIIDYSQTDVQLQLQDFQDKLQRSYLAEEQWFERDTLRNWYTGFLKWVNRGECFLDREGQKHLFEKTVDPEKFYVCLNDYLLSDDGEGQLDDMRMTDEPNPIDRRIAGFKTRINIKLIDSASIQGVQMLKDIRHLEGNYGLPNTFSFEQAFLDYEQYFVFVPETAISMGLSIAACLIVILIITASPQATILVALCVLLTDLFLSALIFYWGLTFNPLVVINIVIAIGLSVDYSAHISHSYLTTQIDGELADYYTTDKQKRIYKTQQALSKMGSSVFHGGFSTFLAIVTLAPSKTYIFLVFFRLWFGIILFGMSNGFMLLPVILSFIGQTENVLDPADENSDSDNEDEARMTKEIPQTDRRDSVFQLSGDNPQKQLELANMQAEEDEKKPKRDSQAPVIGRPINGSDDEGPL